MTAFNPEDRSVSQQGVAAMLGIPASELPSLTSAIEAPEEVKQLLNRIAKDFHVYLSQVQGRERGKKPISTARQFSMWALNTILGVEMESSGSYLGRDRSTAIFAVNKVNEWVAKSPEIRSYTELLTEIFAPTVDGEDLI